MIADVAVNVNVCGGGDDGVSHGETVITTSQRGGLR